MTSAEQIKIVPTALNHVEGFHRALDSVPRERKYLSVFEAFSVQAMRDFVLHQNKTSGPAFIAHREGKVVGWCDIRRQTLPAFAHRGSLGMGVVAEWRGRGIGFRLLDAALDAAFRQGFARVELEVRADNARAIALYDKIGFVREGLLRELVSSTANISTPSPWRSSTGQRYAQRRSRLRDDRGLPPWPVLANGSSTSTPVRRRLPSGTSANGSM